MNVEEKYSDSDFEILGWHDCRIYRFDVPDKKYKLKLEIDYIFKWVKEESVITGFWVSPCTLVFDSINDLKITLDFENSSLLFISRIVRENPRPSPNGSVLLWDYRIELDKGVFEFVSSGFIQYTNSQPVLSDSYDLGRC